jgi:hypothetical protein
MRNLWLSLALLAAVLLSPHPSFAAPSTAIGMPQQCTNSATNPTSAEWLTCTQARAGTTALNPIYTTSAGGAAGSNAYVYDGAAWIQWQARSLGDNVDTTLKMPGALSLGYYFDGMNWDRVRGGTLTDNLTQPTGFPYGASFLMVWDGAKWDRMTQPTGGTSGASGDAISATQTGLYGVSLNHFYNGTNFKRWLGEAVDDSMTEAPVAPWVAAYGVYRNLDGGPVGSQRMTGEGWDSTMSSSPTNLNTNAFGVFYNNTTNRGTYIVGSDAGDTIGATGPIGLSIGHFYNGTGYQRWKGEVWDSSMTAAPINPNTNAYNVFYDGSAGRYWNGNTMGDTLGSPVVPFVGSMSAFYDGTNYRRWTGEGWDTTIDTVTYAPSVIGLNAFYNVTSSKGYMLQGIGTHADGLSNTQAMPFAATFNYGFNGTSWDRLYVLGTQADAQATTVNGLVTSSFLYGYNGSTFDMLRIGASNELQVTDVAVRPGENAGLNVVDTQKVYSKAYTPAKTSTATVADGAGTTVLAAVQIINYPNCTITAKNTHGSVHWTGFEIWTGPTNAGPWTSQTSTACDALVDGTGAECWSSHGHSFNWVYAVAVAASASSSSDVWLTCNAN